MMVKVGQGKKLLYGVVFIVWMGMIALYGIGLFWPLVTRALPYFEGQQQPQLVTLVLLGMVLLVGVLVCWSGLLGTTLWLKNYPDKRYPPLGIPWPPHTWGTWLLVFWRGIPPVGRRWLLALLVTGVLAGVNWYLLLVLARTAGIGA